MKYLRAASLVLLCHAVVAGDSPRVSRHLPGDSTLPTAAIGSTDEIAAEPAPKSTPCPSAVPASVRCLRGRDNQGAFYVIAMPAEWNGVLVLHAHGGPLLGPPTLARVEEDLSRWSIVPRAGYAWAGTSYHQGGVAVRSAGEDLERLRAIFLRDVAKPRTTLAHGQSWGGNVAAKAAETFAAGKPYDGVLLTSGVIAGGTRAYEHRLDARVVYQYLCGNHPKPSEPQYPLWMGLPEDSALTRDELKRRVDQCLGLSLPAADRSPEQTRRLRTIVNVVHIPESSVPDELAFATFTFRDIARRAGWRSVFGNVGARYLGSDDDVALNAGVARYAADPQAVSRYNDDADLTGLIDVPVLTMHAIDDPVAFVEMEQRFGEKMRAAGHAGNLVQTFSQDRVHSYVSDATYVALLDALRTWVVEGRKPTPADVAAGCVAAQDHFASTCHFVPDYRPAALEQRVADRQR